MYACIVTGIEGGSSAVNIAGTPREGDRIGALNGDDWRCGVGCRVTAEILIDAHVVQLVGGAGEGRIDLIAIVGAAHGEVEQQEELLAESFGVGCRRSQGRHVHAVHAEDEGISVPDDGVGVEFGGRVAHRGALGGLDRVASVAGGGVEGVADGVGLAESSPPFHHIDLTAGRPSDRRDVAAQHPSGGPRAATRGELRAELKLAVFEIALVLRLDAG